MNQKRIAFIIVGFLILLGIIFGSFVFVTAKRTPATPTPVLQEVQTLTYRGETGKDALTILKEKATVEQSTSGLVTSINGRKAQDSKHEYWAFYINGKLADVGPAAYETKPSDTILWKIETY